MERTELNLNEDYPREIFVQIASYRDPQLLPTIKDCIAKAKNPELLSFGICWQHSNDDDWDTLDEFKDNPNFRIMDVHWKDSLGVGWARSHTQSLWRGEKYTLQIDSHHRFLHNWDEEMIKMIQQTSSQKPILTSYAGIYIPSENDKIVNQDPYKMVGRFSPYGNILFHPETIEGWEKLTAPIPARFVSGHFFFTLGIHCKEYKYDPNIYFDGEEISLSIRSYTLGYDLFHPHKLVIWHEYTREGRKKHWDDFTFENKQNKTVERIWSEMNESSLIRLRHMLQEENNNIDLGEYGLGTVRSHHEYEIYAGINFELRKLHPDTIAGVNPPLIYETNFDWDKCLNKEYKYEFDIPSYENLQFLYFGVQDRNGKEIYRRDIDNQIQKKLSVNFESFDEPYKYIWWPYFNGNGWGTKVEAILEQ